MERALIQVMADDGRDVWIWSEDSGEIARSIGVIFGAEVSDMVVQLNSRLAQGMPGWAEMYRNINDKWQRNGKDQFCGYVPRETPLLKPPDKEALVSWLRRKPLSPVLYD